MKWIIAMRQSWAMPPDDDAAWNGEDFVPRFKHAKLYDSMADADAALVGVALKFPPEEVPGYYTRTIFVLAASKQQREHWETMGDLEKS